MKIEELKLVNKRVCKVSDLTSSVTQMIRTSAGNHKESICLDGSKLKATHSLAKVFLNSPRNIYSRNNKNMMHSLAKGLIVTLKSSLKVSCVGLQLF